MIDPAPIILKTKAEIIADYKQLLEDKRKTRDELQKDIDYIKKVLFDLEQSN